MVFRKNRSRVVAAAAAAILLASGWLVLKPDHKSPSQTNTPVDVSVSNTGSTPSTSSSTATVIETADFKYQVPTSWLPMKQDALTQSGANSGIARVASTSAAFSTKVVLSTPKDSNDLKNSTLDNVKANAPHFALLSSVSTKVDGQSGQKFTYSFTDKDGNNKLRQQLSAIPYKNKTFFLKASSADADFDKQSGEFDKILGSFHFK